MITDSDLAYALTFRHFVRDFIPGNVPPPEIEEEYKRGDMYTDEFKRDRDPTNLDLAKMQYQLAGRKASGVIAAYFLDRSKEFRIRLQANFVTSLQTRILVVNKKLERLDAVIKAPPIDPSAILASLQDVSTDVDSIERDQRGLRLVPVTAEIAKEYESVFGLSRT